MALPGPAGIQWTTSRPCYISPPLQPPRPSPYHTPHLPEGCCQPQGLWEGCGIAWTCSPSKTFSGPLVDLLYLPTPPTPSPSPYHTPHLPEGCCQPQGLWEGCGIAWTCSPSKTFSGPLVDLLYLPTPPTPSPSPYHTPHLPEGCCQP